MSRSRKKTPIMGMTMADSDREFKTMSHRQARRAEHMAVSVGGEPPAPKAFGDPWKSRKDGKCYWDKPTTYRK